MLDLETSIHFHEIVLLSHSVKNKLDCTGVVVSNCLGSCDSSFTNLPSQISVNQRWCFLNNFLMASLHSAVTFIQVHIVPVFITKNLHFNMSRFFDVLLKDHMVIVKSFHCFVLRWLELSFHHEYRNAYLSESRQIGRERPFQRLCCHHACFQRRPMC